MPMVGYISILFCCPIINIKTYGLLQKELREQPTIKDMPCVLPGPLLRIRTMAQLLRTQRSWDGRKVHSLRLKTHQGA